ncbi:MAG: MFS transporter [Ancalomicrobiaceae bacterium]|nr:MFS transporter [Ancalomicrobiaceae bacterium]
MSAPVMPSVFADLSPSAARWRIVAVFCLHAVVGAMLNIRIPDLQLQSGIDDGELGLVLMGAPAGALATFVFASRLIDGVGTRRVILACFLLMVLSAALLTASGNSLMMFGVLFINGGAMSLSNIAINVEADRVEATTGSRIMNRCHGAWSTTFFVFSLLAGIVRSFDVSPAVHLWTLVPIYAIAALAVVAPMSECPARAFGAPSRRLRFAWPTLAVVSLVGYSLGSQLLEGAARVWATIFLRDAFQVPAIVESFALPALVLAMAVGRLMADHWIDRHGPRRIAGVTSGVALAGLSVVVFANSAYLAIAGFALTGLGIGVVYPLMISAAARLGDRSAAENVAATTLVVQLLTLMAPMLVGQIAQGFGVRAAFGAILPFLVLAWVMSRVLD